MRSADVRLIRVKQLLKHMLCSPNTSLQLLVVRYSARVETSFLQGYDPQQQQLPFCCLSHQLHISIGNLLTTRDSLAELLSSTALTELTSLCVSAAAHSSLSSLVRCCVSSCHVQSCNRHIFF